MIIVMIRWTGLAPSESEFFFAGSLKSFFLKVTEILGLDKKKRDDGILIGVAMKASLDWILEQPRSVLLTPIKIFVPGYVVVVCVYSLPGTKRYNW